MSADEQEVTEGDRRWELWAKLSVVLAVVMAAAWIAVFARLGTLSVQIHAMLIPTLAVAALPLMAWALLRALMRPPAIRTSRLIAFTLLLAVGFVGKEPIVAPPLATESWTTTVSHRLPFEGTWLTISGGEDPARNFKATTAALRWSYDFTKLKDDARHELDGKKAEDYYCFGAPVLAPAPGKVVVATNDVLDNPPGEIISDSIFGNHVVLRIAEDEYIYLAHLQRGSVTVKAGDVVERGAPLGKCGNSGRSVEPHLHVHAQDRLGFPIAQGLPLRFDGVVVNGEAQPGPVMPLGSIEWGSNDGSLVAPQ